MLVLETFVSFCGAAAFFMLHFLLNSRKEYSENRNG
jgi:hypothetical protein